MATTTIPNITGAAQTATPVGTPHLMVDQKTQVVNEMAKDWPMIEDLLGGTRTMRERRIYLPRQPREITQDHDYRTQTATLYPALRRTIGVMVGKPFSKEVTFSDDMPERLKEWSDNIDNAGRNTHAFLQDALEEALSYGWAGVLVDQPRMVVNRATGEGTSLPVVEATLADVKDQGIRPYFSLYRHNQILGWRAESRDGVEHLAQLRLREFVEEPVGEYDMALRDAVRVLRPGSWELWKKNGSGGYDLASEDQGTTDLDTIPFVPFYGRRKSFMVGESPLIDLAYLNVKHYQVQSDQDDSTRFARKRLIVFIGVDKAEMGEVEASSSSALILPESTSKVEIVQGSAESVKVGREELADLEEQMVRTGAELLVMKPSGQRTATQDTNEAEANRSELQRIVEAFEDGVDQLYQFAAQFIGEEDGGHVQMFKDFGSFNLTDASADIILKMQTAGLLSKETTIREQQRRGLIAADLDPEEELEAVDEEGPPPGMDGLDPITGEPLEDDMNKTMNFGDAPTAANNFGNLPPGTRPPRGNLPLNPRKRA